jgi:hypothetical protein
LASRLLLRVAEQHHIGLAVAADDGELFAVEGEVEVADELGFEIGQLLAGSTAPKENRSLRPSSSLPLVCSGDM